MIVVGVQSVRTIIRGLRTEQKFRAYLNSLNFLFVAKFLKVKDFICFCILTLNSKVKSEKKILKTRKYRE